ncbi:hypothetical protein LLG46_05845 [bacterium]|nr:hypothetical protein [bacterium]
MDKDQTSNLIDKQAENEEPKRGPEGVPESYNLHRMQSSGTVRESIRDWPSDGPCDPFRRRSDDD